MDEAEARERRLDEVLRELGTVGVAFSGGVDSTYLLHRARRVLGAGCMALTVRSPFQLPDEYARAQAQALSLDVRHITVEAPDIVDVADVAANTEERCYHCKRIVFARLLQEVTSLGLAALVDGTNADDGADYRPGSRAAAELGVRSPLQEVGLRKAHIRQRSRQAGLPTWDRPSDSCLAARVPYGVAITAPLLAQIGAAECVLRERGLRQVRVRHHGPIARIEVGRAEREALLQMADEVTEIFQKLGYTYVTMELTGYRTGSLNAGLPAAQLDAGAVGSGPARGE